MKQATSKPSPLQLADNVWEQTPITSDEQRAAAAASIEKVIVPRSKLSRRVDRR